MLTREEKLDLAKILWSPEQIDEKVRAMSMRSTGLILADDLRIDLVDAMIDTMPQGVLIMKTVAAMNERGFLVSMSNVDLETGTCAAEFFKDSKDYPSVTIEEDMLHAVVRAAIKRMS